jgi:hypothetical protein
VQFTEVEDFEMLLEILLGGCYGTAATNLHGVMRRQTPLL